MTTEPQERLTLRMKEVAALTGVGLTTVKDWCRTGRLKTVRIGGVVLVRPEHLQEFLDAHVEGLDVRRPLRAVTTRR